ncbi:protein kinase [Streptomyces sp. NPDC057011]|uniref:serine/threonine-protein kinase n=1 Tax=unclassified Streptomyces TaxID=2593676 RepID=UPI003625F68C
MAAVFPLGLAKRFEPIRAVGRGGMGTVFEANDRRLERRVAVKVLTAYGAFSRSAVDRFEAEARALARISHPNVVSVYDVGVDDYTPFLVMEFLDGTDVSELVRGNGALPLGEACRIAADTLAGLGAAHREGVLHRDVKPANIRVTSNGRVVLYDFGLARLTGEAALTRTGEDLLGTPQYMAPECITGQPPQATSDVYGVGACLHHMLTGASPFGDVQDVGVLLFRAVQDGIPSLSDGPVAVPAGLSAAVDALSARDPAARTPSAAAAEALIRPWADDEDLTLDYDAVRQEVRPMDNYASVPPMPPYAPMPQLEDEEPAEGPEYDWHQVDVRPPRQPEPEPEPQPEPALGTDRVTLSESTRRLVHSRMTEQTALSRQREAVGLIQRGRLSEAMDRLSGLGAFCVETLGPGHPTTLACQYWQAVCLARQGKAPQALELFARVTAHHGHGRGTGDE